MPSSPAKVSWATSCTGMGCIASYVVGKAPVWRYTLHACSMTNVVEQACNVYLQTGAFPTTYEAMQPMPVQEVAQLTFAGDDGMQAGQTYRARIERSEERRVGKECRS